MVNPCPPGSPSSRLSPPPPVLPLAIFRRGIPPVWAGCPLGSAVRVGSLPLSIFSPRLYHCVADQAVTRTRNTWKGSGTPEPTQSLSVPPTPAHRRPSRFMLVPTHCTLFSDEMGILFWVAAHVGGTPGCCVALAASREGDNPHETPMYTSLFAPQQSLPRTSERPSP